jgi:mannose-6-phosphate isomerase-like protein (cupin superfamily)
MSPAMNADEEMSVVRIADAEQPRRVVTGVRADGRSWVARDELVEDIDYPLTTPPAPPGQHGRDYNGGSTRFFRIWGSDRLPIPLPSDGRAPFLEFEPTPEETPEALRRSATCPPPLGVRVSWSRTVPGQAPTPPSRMHFTETTDIVFVMSGRHGEILDDGELLLRAGDVFIQNGTNHSHEHFGDEPVVIGWVLLGALSTGWTPGADRLHAVSGPLGGWRRGETRDKAPMAAWTASSPPPGRYDDRDRQPLALEDLDRPRRVVSGTNAEGRSYYARVEPVDPVDDAASGRPAGPVHFHRIWQSDRLPDLLPTDGLTPPLGSRIAPEDTPAALQTLPYLPAPLGYVASIVRIDPTDDPLPFVQHATMDVVFVMAGEVTLLLDGGDEVRLRPGDVLIQNGTRHAWHNLGVVPALLGVTSLGGAWLGAGAPV